MEILMHALEHAFLDTLKLVPFLFVTYLAMEALEHHAGKASEAAVRKAGKAGPAIGALLGVVPQCGFSAAASTLYAARVVTLGTLFAVFLSTSDEMLPILIAEQAPMVLVVKVLAIKAVVGMAVGFAIDAALHAMRRDREHSCAFTSCASAINATATGIAPLVRSSPNLLTIMSTMRSTCTITRAFPSRKAL